MKYYEEFKEVGFLPVSYPELDGYEVGEDGTVISFKRSGGKMKVLKGWVCCQGYRWVTSTHRNYKVSRLVADAFLDKEDGKNFVLHNDGNRLNNSVSNLRWGNHAENMLDMIAHGRTQKDMDWFRNPKLKAHEVLDIRRSYDEGASLKGLAKKYDVQRATVRAILDGRTWKHLLGDA